MKKEDVVIGKQYRKIAGEGDLGWFAVGSIVTIKKEFAIGGRGFIFHATGPANEPGVAGLKCEKGDTIEGYVYVGQLEEIEAPVVESVDVHVSINPNSTTIVIQRRLSLDEVKAALKAAGVE
jgi:hypothetical protein